MFEIIEPKHPRRVHERTVDTLAMLHSEGKTLEQLGYFLGISRERVRQLFEREGISSKGGGQAIRKVKRMGMLQARRIASREKTERKMELIFGCPYEELTSICGLPVTYSNIQSQGSPQNGYFQQKRNAATRGIGWDMSLPQWWKVWQDSGKWHQRGRGKYKYCMSRESDKGPYCITNVKIVSNHSNASSGQTKFRNGKQRDELGLTSAERHVYDLIQSGLSSPTVIGRMLRMKPMTISGIKQNLRARLGIYNGIQRKLKRGQRVQQIVKAGNGG